MKALMISNDPKILEEGSAVRARATEYAKHFDELHMLYVTGRSFSHSPFAAVKAGEKILRERGFGPDDLITVQDPFLTASAGARLKKRFGSRLEIQIHTDIGSPYYAKEKFTNKIRLWSARKNIPHADHIRVVSERIKRFLIDAKCLRVLADKIEVRPIFVDTEKIKNTPITADLRKKYPQFKKIILMASRLTHEKDIPTALRAFALVRERTPDSGLIIVGSGPLKFAPTKNVIFENWADQSTLFSYYKTADIFLSTSRYEGYGMSMVEAHAAGCPVVATDAGVAPQIAEKVCPVGDVDCLAEGLLSVIERHI
jgi:glycosyltransferase involved in cell wall biosynthesis